MRIALVLLPLWACSPTNEASLLEDTFVDTGTPGTAPTTATGPALARGCHDAALTVTQRPDGYQEVETEHYRLTVDASADAIDLAHLVEAAYTAYGEDLGVALPAGPLELTLFANATDWADGLSARGIPVPTGAAGYYDPRTGLASLYRQPTAYYTQMLWLHEAFHQVHLQARTRPDDLPIWYLEGLAEWASRHDWDGRCVAIGADPRVTFEDSWAIAAESSTSGADLQRWIDDDAFPGRPEMMSLVHHAERDDTDRWRAFRDAMDFGDGGDYLVDTQAWTDHVSQNQEPLTPIWLDWIHRTPDTVRGVSPGVLSVARSKEAPRDWTVALSLSDAAYVGGLIGWSDDSFDLVLVDAQGEVSRWQHTPTLDDWSVIDQLDAVADPLVWTQGPSGLTLGGQTLDVVSDLPPAAGHALYDGVADFVLLTSD
jgi:hypothetical protein